jgi:hypothetical protein
MAPQVFRHPLPLIISLQFHMLPPFMRIDYGASDGKNLLVSPSGGFGPTTTKIWLFKA